mmetsp:Transcript_3793/g.14407  ORF Transcript_3793/g.14407 Transcript_3793/m.14407 type:complete len:1042 (-) Transcript_3793:22-3147(-)
MSSLSNTSKRLKKRPSSLLLPLSTAKKPSESDSPPARKRAKPTGSASRLSSSTGKPPYHVASLKSSSHHKSVLKRQLSRKSSRLGSLLASPSSSKGSLLSSGGSSGNLSPVPLSSHKRKSRSSHQIQEGIKFLDAQDQHRRSRKKLHKRASVGDSHSKSRELLTRERSMRDVTKHEEDDQTMSQPASMLNYYSLIEMNNSDMQLEGQPRSPSDAAPKTFFHLSRSGYFCAFVVEDKLKIVGLISRSVYVFRLHSKHMKQVSVISMHPRKKIVAARAGNLIIVLKGTKQGKLETVKHVPFPDEEVEWMDWVQQGEILAFATSTALYHVLMPPASTTNLKDHVDSCPQGFYKVLERDDTLIGEDWKVVDHDTDEFGTNSYLIVQDTRDPLRKSFIQFHKMHSRTSKLKKGHAACFMRLRTEKSVTPSFSLAYHSSSSKKTSINSIEITEGSRKTLRFRGSANTVDFGTTKQFPRFLVPCLAYGLLYAISSKGDVCVLDVATSKTVLKRAKRIVTDDIVFACPHVSSNGVLLMTNHGHIKVLHLEEQRLPEYTRKFCPELPRIWKDMQKRKAVHDVVDDTQKQLAKQIIFEYRTHREQVRQEEHKENLQRIAQEKEDMLQRMHERRAQERLKIKAELEEKKQAIEEENLRIRQEKEKEARQVAEEAKARLQAEEEKSKEHKRQEEQQLAEQFKIQQEQKRAEAEDVQNWIIGLARDMLREALDSIKDSESPLNSSTDEPQQLPKSSSPLPEKVLTEEETKHLELERLKKERIQLLVDRIHRNAKKTQRQNTALNQIRIKEQEAFKQLMERPEDDLLFAQNAVRNHHVFSVVFLEARPRCARENLETMHLTDFDITEESLREFFLQLFELSNCILQQMMDLNSRHPLLTPSKQTFKAVGLFVGDQRVPLLMKTQLYSLMKSIHPNMWENIDECLRFLNILRHAKSTEVLQLGEPPMLVAWRKRHESEDVRSVISRPFVLSNPRSRLEKSLQAILEDSQTHQNAQLPTQSPTHKLERLVHEVDNKRREERRMRLKAKTKKIINNPE